MGRDNDIDELRAEVARLRELVGPDEKSYVQLQIDLLGARDAAIGAEAELGTVRGYNQALEAEVVRLQRDFEWFRDTIVSRLTSSSLRSTWFGRMMLRLAGR